MILLLTLLLFAVVRLSAIQDTLIESAMKQPDSLRLSYILKVVGQHYRSLPDESLVWIDKVIQESFNPSNPGARSQAYRFAGAILKNRGEYAKSLSYHLKSLKINDSLDNKAALATNYNDIGIVYKNLGEYQSALDSYSKANALVTELGMNKGVVMTLNNLGTIYEALNQHENALKYYNRAYAKAQEFGIVEGLSVSLSNIGELYANKGDRSRALFHFREALKIDELSGDLVGSAVTRLNMAAMLLGEKQWDSAVYHYNKSRVIAEQYNSYDLLTKVYNGLTRFYEEQGDYKNALVMYKLARNAQDSVYNEIAAKQLAEMKSRFQALQKDREIDQLKTDNLLNELKIKEQRADRYALLISFGFAALITFMLVRRHQTRQEQKHNLEIIKQRDENLSALVEVQENERKELAKELHDGVGQMLSGLRLGLSTLKVSLDKSNLNTFNISDLLNTLDQTVTEVRGISHRMMPRILQEEGLVPAIQDMLEKSFKFSQVEWVFEHFGLKERYPESMEISLFRICQELINNIIKHSEASKVNVQLIQNQGYLVLFVEDNGRGFLNDSKDKGIGLLNISTRLKNLHGEFKMEASPESGITATIRIPIS